MTMMRVTTRALGLFLWAGLLATPAAAETYTFINVADSTGPYSLFSAPAINDAGTVAFRANLDAGAQGIFTGPDPLAHAVATNYGPYQGFAPP